MKILIIDSHKSTSRVFSANLHLQNARQVQQALTDEGHDVDLIWSYKGVNDQIGADYDIIIFNHASAYCYVDREWLSRSPKAKLVYLTNEYNLGEPRILWDAAKRQGRHYRVIANHPKGISKVVKAYIRDWHIVNLNTLVVNPVPPSQSGGDGIIYYGSFRADRSSSFRRYLRGGEVIISTHPKNRDKFNSMGINGPFIDRLDWGSGQLGKYKASLYIEDEVTHHNYNFLANRFYEALNHNVIPVFGFECRSTIDKSGYVIPDELIIDDPSSIGPQIQSLKFNLIPWQQRAMEEKRNTIKELKALILE